MAAAAIAIDHVSNMRRRAISQQMTGWRPVAFEEERVVTIGATRFEARVGGAFDQIAVTFADGAVMEVASGWRPGEPVWRGMVGEAVLVMQVRPTLNGVTLATGGHQALARVFTRREAELAALMPAHKVADTGKTLLCPMPGLVKVIAVKEGQEVKAGEPLAIVEAMKMENVLRAEKDVTVKKLAAKEGDSLAVDAVIMEFA
jgi:propionyl-CoA carboxylase alpha chain